MTYFPLDRDILTSSVWAQGTPEQLKVWFYLLVAANPRNGVVEDADPGVALRCGLSVEATVAALDWLAAPDPHSRTKDHDGRRIERLPEGGIRILNYSLHRDKDYSTPRWRRWKEHQKANALANAQTAANAVGNDLNEHGHVNEQRRETPADAGTSRPRRSRKATATDHDTPEARQGCEDYAEILQRAIDYSASKLGLFDRLIREGRTREEWRSVITAYRDRSVSSARFARDGNAAKGETTGPGLAWALRPGAAGGFDPILLQIEGRQDAAPVTESPEEAGRRRTERALRAVAGGRA